MAGLMDFMGGMFGGGDVYGDLLSDEQKKAMQQQTMMTMAAKLLQAGGPSTTPTNLGQALGGAFLTGQEAYGKAGQNALQGMLTKQKIDEYQAGKARQAAFDTFLQGGGQASPTFPSTKPITLGSVPQASTPGMPQAGMPQAGMTNQPGMTPQAGLNSILTPEQKQLMRFMSPEQQQKAVFDAASQRETFGNPITEVGEDGNPVSVMYGNRGTRRLVSGATPYSKPSTGIEEYKFAQGQGYTGTFKDFQEGMKKAGASSNSVTIPAGMTPMGEAVDKKFAEQYVDWKSGGNVNAARNLTQISGVLDSIASGQQVSGAMQGLVPNFVKAFTNPNSVEAQEQVAGVVQQSMKEIMGNQFTEKEGAQLIARAFNPQLEPQVNARRLAMLMEQLKGQARAKQAMVDYVDEKGTLVGYKGPRVDAASFYSGVLGQLDGGQGKDVSSYFK